MVRLESIDLIRFTLKSGAIISVWVTDWTFAPDCSSYSYTRAYFDGPYAMRCDQIAAVELVRRRYRIRFGRRR